MHFVATNLFKIKLSSLKSCLFSDSLNSKRLWPNSSTLTFICEYPFPNFRMSKTFLGKLASFTQLSLPSDHST